ncbi:MAG: hypothetical protein AMXMBFR7_26380 [Planctomycetota bacterium]
MPKICGEYNEHGYEVFQVGPDGIESIYQAGSAHGESAPVSHEGPGLSLIQIATLCRKTTRELAAERGAEYGGIDRAFDP